MLLIMDFTNQRSGCLDGSVYSFLWLWQNAWGKQLTGRKGSSESWMLRFQSVVDSMAVGARREVRTLWGWGHVRLHKASQCKTGLTGRGRGEAGHVSWSICQSVSLSIRYTLQWLHPLCVSKAREVCLSPWSWSHRQFWAARGGTQTLVPWKIASTLNQPQHALQHPDSLDTVRGHEQSWNGRLEMKGGGYYITKDFKLTFSKYIEFFKYKIFEDKHLERQRNFQKKITAYDSTLEFSSC